MRGRPVKRNIVKQQLTVLLQSCNISAYTCLKLREQVRNLEWALCWRTSPGVPESPRAEQGGRFYPPSGNNAGGGGDKAKRSGIERWTGDALCAMPRFR